MALYEDIAKDSIKSVSLALASALSSSICDPNGAEVTIKVECLILTFVWAPRRYFTGIVAFNDYAFISRKHFPLKYSNLVDVLKVFVYFLCLWVCFGLTVIWGMFNYWIFYCNLVSFRHFKNVALWNDFVIRFEELITDSKFDYNRLIQNLNIHYLAFVISMYIF